jgi:hypothetical protein
MDHRVLQILDREVVAAVVLARIQVAVVAMVVLAVPALL